MDNELELKDDCEVIEKEDIPIFDNDNSDIPDEDVSNLIEDELIDLREVDQISYVYGRFANCFVNCHFDSESVPAWIALDYQKQLQKLYKKKNRQAIKQVRRIIRQEKKLSRREKTKV